MYALVEVNGKQYKAKEGSVIKVDLFDMEAGSSIDLDKVLMVSGDDSVKVGSPYVEGVSVKTTLRENIKDKKVKVFKMKRRKGYRRTQGHRQKYSLLTIDAIQGV